MLFDAIIRGLEVMSDVIEFGPTKAAQINTSFMPEYERDVTRILDNLEKNSYTSTSSYTNPSVIQERKDENESVLDQAEEDMIDKAVAEKGCY